MSDPAAKRRKWDVAAPQGISVSNTRAGIGSAGVTAIGHPAYGGSLPEHPGHGTALGQAPLVAFAPAPPAQPVVPLPKIDVNDIKGKPLDEDTVKRLQQSAAAIVEKMNQVGGCEGT